MAEYSLEDGAERDLLDIGRYTAREWSLDQAIRYLSALESHFSEIARRTATEKPVFHHRDDLRVSRCQHHYVFFVRDGDDSIVILAILHENMDLIARFRERLEGPR